MNEDALAPTLWRTCRALANLKRLEIIRSLIEEPAQTVSSVAARHNIRTALASEYLRALNARGVLRATRRSKNVFYSVKSNPSIPWTGQLVSAINKVFAEQKQASSLLYRQATAFTHPRRILICRVLLSSEPLEYKQLSAKCRISRPALIRHLQKLQNRGFVSKSLKGWVITVPKDHLSKTFIAIISKL